MQSFLRGAVVIIIFAFAFAAINPGKPAGQFKSFRAIKKSSFTFVHFGPGKGKMGGPSASNNKATSGPAELTLEYFAVQLFR